MTLTLRHLTSRILSIAYVLEFDEFILKERRERLKSELSSLLLKRDNLLKKIDQEKAQPPNE